MNDWFQRFIEYDFQNSQIFRSQEQIILGLRRRRRRRRRREEKLHLAIGRMMETNGVLLQRILDDPTADWEGELKKKFGRVILRCAGFGICICMIFLLTNTLLRSVRPSQGLKEKGKESLHEAASPLFSPAEIRPSLNPCSHVLESGSLVIRRRRINNKVHAEFLHRKHKNT